MQALPDGLKPYRKTPLFTAETVPAGLLRDHRTRPGVWGLIHVVRGRLRYRIAATGEEMVLTAAAPGVVEPDTAHAVAPVGDVTFCLEFWR